MEQSLTEQQQLKLKELEEVLEKRQLKYEELRTTEQARTKRNSLITLAVAVCMGVATVPALMTVLKMWGLQKVTIANVPLPSGAHVPLQTWLFLYMCVFAAYRVSAVASTLRGRRMSEDSHFQTGGCSFHLFGKYVTKMSSRLSTSCQMWRRAGLSWMRAIACLWHISGVGRH